GEFDRGGRQKADGQQARLVSIRGVRMELVLPVVEGVRGDAFLLTEGDDVDVGVGEALQSLDPNLARLGAGAGGPFFGQGHGSSPEDRATPPKIIPLSMT